MKVKEDLLKTQWEDIKKTTDEQLKTIISMLNAQHKTKEPATSESMRLNNKTSSDKTSNDNNKGNADNEGWTTVERKKKTTLYRVYVRGRGKERLSNKVIRARMERALSNEHAQLTSVTSTRDYSWAVSLAMTCPIEMQHEAEILNKRGLLLQVWLSRPPG